MDKKEKLEIARKAMQEVLNKGFVSEIDKPKTIKKANSIVNNIKYDNYGNQIYDEECINIEEEDIIEDNNNNLLNENSIETANPIPNNITPHKELFGGKKPILKGVKKRNKLVVSPIMIAEYTGLSHQTILNLLSKEKIKISSIDIHQLIQFCNKYKKSL